MSSIVTHRKCGYQILDTRVISLSDTKIRNTKPGKKPIKLTDGGGLYLEVRPTGAKLWRSRFRIAAKENVFALGEHCQVPAGVEDAEATIRKASGR